MKLIHALAMTLIVAASATAQTDSKPEPKQETDGFIPLAITTTPTLAASPIVIYSADENGRLIEVLDKDGKVILTAYRDGHVVAADPSKIDEAAKIFWQELAKHYALMCNSPEVRKEHS